MAFTPQNPFEFVEQLLGQAIDRISTGFQQGQLILEQPPEVPEAEVDSELYKRVAQQITNDLKAQQQALQGLRAEGAPPEKIRRQELVVSGLHRLQAMPSAMLPQAYQEFLQSTIVPRVEFEADLPWQQPGAAGPPPDPARPRPVEEPPLFPGPSMTMAEQMGFGPGMVSQLERQRGYAEAQADELRRVLNAVDPDEPYSVVRARLMLDQGVLEALPPATRDLLAPQVHLVNAALEDPRVREMYDDAVRRAQLELRTAQATTEAAETGAERVALDLEQARLTYPLEFRALEDEFRDASAQRVLDAADTGMLDGLNGEERSMLARYVGVSEENLEDWSSTQRERALRRQELTDLMQEQDWLERSTLWPIDHQRARLALRLDNIAAAQAGLDLQWSSDRYRDWKRRAPLEFERLQLALTMDERALDDAAAERIWRARETGVLAGLDEDERAALADWWGVSVGQLPARAGQQRRFVQAVEVATGRMRILDYEQAKITYPMDVERLQAALVADQRALDDAAAARIWKARETGVIAGLSDDELDALADWWGVPRENLGARAAERRSLLERTDIATAESVILDYEQAKQVYPLELQRLEAQLGDDSARRIWNARETGVLTGLSADERAALADWWGVTEAGLAHRAREQRDWIQSLEDLEGKLSQADLQSALLALERGGEELEVWRRRHPVEYDILVRTLARADADLVDSSFNRIERAYETGNLFGLSDNERNALASYVGVEVSELEDWARERADLVDQLVQLDLQRAELQIQQMEQAIELGDQTFERTALLMEHEAWQRERERFMVDVADARDIATAITNAVHSGDPQLITWYLNALNDPASNLGIFLNAAGVTREQLKGHLQSAQEIHDLDRRKLDADVELRESQAELALIDLRENRELSPYRLSALRAQYELDSAKAHRDLGSLAWDQMIDRAHAITELAEAVPPEYWDTLPAYVAAGMRDANISVDAMRARSETAEWARQDPVRQQGRDMFMFLAKQVPLGADEAQTEARTMALLESAREAMDMMGIEDPLMRAGLESGLLSAWELDSEMARLRLLELEMNVFGIDGEGPMDSTELKRRLDSFSSAYTSARQSMNDFAANELGTYGCARIAETPYTYGFVVRETYPDQPVGAGSRFEGELCEVPIAHWQGLKELTDSLLQRQVDVANMLGLPLDIPGVVGPEHFRPGLEAPEMQGTAQPAPTGDPRVQQPTAEITELTGPQMVAGVQVDPYHVGLANRIAHYMVEGQREEGNALIAEFESIYGEEAMSAILDRIFGRED